MARLTLPFCAFTLLTAASASAQDFGTDWIDRVTHELIEEQAPLNPHPLEFHASVGELYSYDTNIFLTNTGREHDSIFTTFGVLSLKYAQPEFDAEANLTVNYNAYIQNSDASADEERFFGRIRYQGSSLSLQLAEIVRRESSPTDVIFIKRVSRFLSSTTPIIAWKITPVVALEAQSDVQLVRFLRTGFENGDNFNTRSTLTGAYTTGWNDIEALLQLGYTTINYRLNTAAPDAGGFFIRAGARGELSPNLYLLALVGYSSASSDDIPGTNVNFDINTMDADIHLAYTVTDKITAYADYSRRITFAIATSFEVVDSSAIIVRAAMREDLTLKARLQYDRAHPVPGPVRSYSAAGAGLEYRVLEHLQIEGNLTYRMGRTQGDSAGDFGDGIFSVGIVGTF
jgi:hypothetical protein